MTPATLNVNSLLDNLISDSYLTLREALIAVNNGGTAGFTPAELAQITGAFGPSDTILFTGLSGTITISESLLPEILVPLTIQGPGSPADLVISGNGIFSLFDTRFALNGNADVISFRNLTLTEGLGTSTTGGALTIDDESVTVTNCVIANNKAYDGGGIRVHGPGSLTLTGSVITNNTTTDDNTYYGGGGIFLETKANLTLQNTTISNNTSASFGGGILFYNDTGTVDISRSTISGNVATLGRGGAFYSFGASKSFTLSNSTVSGNSSLRAGGGLALISFDSTAVIQNSTVTGNTGNAKGEVASVGESGGGLAIAGGVGTVSITSTLISGNIDGSNQTGDLFCSAISPVIRGSAISDATGYTLGGGSDAAFNPTFEALNFEDLAYNNGGTTQTHALIPGSVAINAGLNLAGLSVDQNGSTREQPSGSPDIGAYEAIPPTNPTAQATFTTINTGSPYLNTPSYQFTVKYTAPTGGQINTATLGPADVAFTGPGGYAMNASYVSFTDPNGDQTVIIATYTLSANPLGTSLWDAADNGTYSATMLAGEVKTQTTNLEVQTGSLGKFKVVLPTTYSVTNANNAGAGSLRQAILDANANSPAADTIVFNSGLFQGSLQTIPLTSTLTISDALTITGPGSDLVALSGNNLVRILDVSTSPQATAINLSNLTLTNGSANGSGGAIASTNQKVSLSNVLVKNCVASKHGGAISVGKGNGQLSLTNTTLSGNSAASMGGGLYLASGSPALTVSNSTITGNSANGNGGGVYFRSGGSVSITNSTISNNVCLALQGGAGLYFFGSTTAFDIRNTTISGNSSSTGDGGGIRLAQATGTFNIRNSTIANNTAPSGGGLASTEVANTTTINFLSTIVSGNTGGTNGDLDILDGPDLTLNVDYAAISDADGYIVNGTNTNNLSAANSAFGPTGLKLGPLQVNVAGTATHALGSGSKATNAGSNPAPALTTDQRGNGFLRDVNQTDIGAYETQPAAPVVNHIDVNGSSAFTDVSRSRILSIEVYFNGDVIPASFSTLNAITLTRLSSNVSPAGPVVATGVTSGANGVITVQQGQLSSSLKLTFRNADLSPLTTGVEANSLSDGRWELAIPASTYNSTLAGLSPVMLRRLFGDNQNDGTVNGSDLVQFGNVFSSNTAPLFDYNGDGTVNGADLVELGNRFGRGF